METKDKISYIKDRITWRRITIANNLKLIEEVREENKKLELELEKLLEELFALADNINGG